MATSVALSRLRRMYGVDPRAMVAARVSVGLILLLDMLERTGLLAGRMDVDAFFSDQGLWDRKDVKSSVPFSIFLASGDPWVVRAIWLVGVASAVALVVGEKPRQAAFLCLVVIQGAYYRMTEPRVGYDLILMRQLFFFAFDWGLPLMPTPRQPSTSPGMLLRVGGLGLLWVQCSLYIGSGLAKAVKPWVHDADAVLEAVMNPYYGQGMFVADLLRNQPLLLVLASRATVLVEVFIGLLILAPVVFPEFVRVLAFLLICGLQIGLNLVLDLGFFGVASCFTTLPLLPQCVWDLMPQQWFGGGDDVVSDSAGNDDDDAVSDSAREALNLGMMKRGFRGIIRLTSFVVVAFGLFVTVYGDARMYGTSHSYGAEQPFKKLPAIPQPMQKMAEALGVEPTGWYMFEKYTGFHGWLIALGRFGENGEIVRLPTYQKISSAEEAFRRPPANWLPTMRWKQYWRWLLRKPMAENNVKAMRDRFRTYFCNKGMDRVQLFYVDHTFEGWAYTKDNSTYVAPYYPDYPELKEVSIYAWLCSKRLVDMKGNGTCGKLCAPSILDVLEPQPNTAVATSGNKEL